MFLFHFLSSLETHRERAQGMLAIFLIELIHRFSEKIVSNSAYRSLRYINTLISRLLNVERPPAYAYLPRASRARGVRLHYG